MRIKVFDTPISYNKLYQREFPQQNAKKYYKLNKK